MSAIIQPISSDGGFTTGGNINVSSFPVSSPAPYINGFSSVEALDQLKIGDARFYSNGSITNSTLSVDANTSARLSVIDPNTVFNTYFQAVENYANIYVANGSGDATWQFTSDGNLTLPGNTFSVNYANGTQVSIGGGGGGGNSISDGTSNVSVVSTDGNVVIGIDNDIVSWTFATDGTIYSKSETDYKVLVTDPNGDGYAVKHFVNDGTQDLSLTSLTEGQFSIYTNLDGAGEEWRFSGNTLQVSTNSTIRGFDSGIVVESMYAGGNGTASLRSVSNANEPNIFSTFDATTTSANITVYNGGSVGGTGYTWKFDNNGNLTLPANTFAVNYANGTQVSLGGGSYSNADVANYLPTFTGGNIGSPTGGQGVTNLNLAGNIVATPQLMSINWGTYHMDFSQYGRVEINSDFFANANTIGAQYLKGDGSNISNIAGANISGLGNITTVNLTGSNTNVLYGNGVFAAPTAGTSANIANGNSNVNIATANGNVTIAAVGNTTMTVTGTGANVTGYANITGNITTGNVVFGANTGQVAFNTGAYISGNGASSSREGSIVLQPYTGAGSNFAGVQIGGAGRLISPNGGVFQIFNAADVTFQVATKITAGTAATTPIAAAVVVTGGIGASGTSVTGVGSLLTGPTFTPLANTVAGFNSNVNSYTQVTLQNKSNGADATTDYVLTADNGSDTVNYGDFGIINSGYDANTPTNSLGNIVYAADTYMYAQGNTGNSSQSGGNLAIGTTVPGKNVKIFAGGVDNTAIVANISNTGIAVTGNITATGNISANNFSGNISITGNVTGTSSNVTLVAGSYSATMDNTGYFSAPTLKSTNSVGNEGGEIQLAKSANATVSGNTVSIDSYNDRIRFFEGGGSSRGAYIDLTQAPAGVSYNIINRAFGIAGANTAVTLDNIQARVGGSPTRLYINTVSGSMTGAGDSQTMTSGSMAVSSWINVSIGQGAGNAFAMSGALSQNGDTAILSLIDQGSGTGMWRITGMIANTTANLYGVSIERLV